MLSSIHSVHVMNADWTNAQWPPTIKPSQPTASPLTAATIYAHRCHFINNTQPDHWYSFYCPRRVTVRVDLHSDLEWTEWTLAMTLPWWQNYKIISLYSGNISTASPIFGNRVIRYLSFSKQNWKLALFLSYSRKRFFKTRQISQKLRVRLPLVKCRGIFDDKCTIGRRSLL